MISQLKLIKTDILETNIHSIIYLVDLSKKLNLCGWVGVTVRPISRVYYYYYDGTRGTTK